MSTSSSDSVFSLGTTLIQLTPGGSFPVFFQSVAGQNGWHIKYQSGGTLFLIGSQLGTTISSAALLGATGHYMFGVNEALDIGGPCNFYLVALGATTLVNALRTFSSGF